MPTPERTPRFLTFAQVRERFQVSDKTPKNWVSKGYLQVYRADDGTLLLNLDEIEATLRILGPSKMRTGLRRYGAAVKPLPIEAVGE
ncbi:hypothetical protein [Microbacterium sp. LWO13-1.2]|uniref:hypothetical protein n=1 Tax=Microbacterium sp. LWO13-1.2 TaxID=3135262 RepID=UPI0031389B27